MTGTKNINNKAKKKLESLIIKHNFQDFKWIDPNKIVVSQWVRMKCMFGCNEYGRNAACPPNVPSVAECEKFFHEYKLAVIFHFSKKVGKPEDRFKWSRELNLKLLKLEREVFLSGYVKAFLLFLDSCRFCAECAGIRHACKTPKMARPGVDAMAVDVFTTVRQYGYPIEVCKDYAQEMNRFSFLLIE